MNTALILIDFQNEWVDKNSDYFVGDIGQMLERTNKLINYCRSKSYKIIFTRHIELESSTAFTPSSKNVELISTIGKQSSDVVITKNKISPFYRTDLENELKGVKNLIICGLLTNLCVRSAVQDAYDRDFNITVVKDCCVSFDKQTQDFTFKDLKATREEVDFLNLAELIKP